LTMSEWVILMSEQGYGLAKGILLATIKC